MKTTIEIPFGNFVNSGSSLELIDVFILAAITDGKISKDSKVNTNKKSVERLLSPFSITWDRAKKRIFIMGKLGYVYTNLDNNYLTLITLENTERMFKGEKVSEWTEEKTPDIVAINESTEETNYIQWVVNGPLKHSTYVTKAKEDMKARLTLIESYRKLRKIYAKEDVFHAIKFATSDEFWRKNFLSPLKLEQVQKSSGMKYIDLFLSLRNASKPQSSSPSQKKENNSRSLD